MEARRQAEAPDYNPFQTITNYFIQNNAALSTKKSLEMANRFADILKIIDLYIEEPYSAREAVGKYIFDCNEADFEKNPALSDTLPNKFEMGIRRVRDLTADKLIACFKAYTLKTAENADKRGIHNFILNSLNMNLKNNPFYKLHYYLQTVNAFEVNSEQKTRKFNDFIALLDIFTSLKPLQDESMSVEAKNLVYATAFREKAKDCGIKKRDLLPNRNRRGDFANLLEELSNEKIYPNDKLVAARFEYQELLETQCETPSFTESIWNAMRPAATNESTLQIKAS